MVALTEKPPINTPETEGAATRLAELFAAERPGTYEVQVGMRGRFERGNDMFSDADKKNKKETIEINLRSPTIVEAGNAFEKAIEAVLAKLPIAEHVQVESDEDHVKKMRGKIEEFTAKGAKFDPRLLSEWKGFDPERRDYEIEDHALQNLQRNETGASFSIHFRKKAEDAGASVAESTQLAEAINKDQDGIKAVISYQLKKSIKDKTPEEIDAAVQAMTIKAEPKNYDNSEGVYVTIQSPEQLAAAKEPAETQRTADQQKVLRESSLLTRQDAGENNLSDKKFGKTLGRAFLYDMEKDKEGKDRPTKANAIFYKIAGRKDVQGEIARTLKRFEANTPGSEKDVKEFLEDDLFKNHDRWGGMAGEKKEPMKGKVDITPNASGDVTITFGVPEGKGYDIIKQIASGKVACEEKAPAQPAVPAAEACAQPEVPCAPTESQQLNDAVKNVSILAAAAQTAAAQLGQPAGSWTEEAAARKAALQGPRVLGS